MSTKKRTPRIWGSPKQGYWTYTGRYGQDRVSPIFKTQDEARRWREEGMKLRRAGYFPWGSGAWIHRDDEGRVMTTREALAELHNAAE